MLQGGLNLNGIVEPPANLPDASPDKLNLGGIVEPLAAPPAPRSKRRGSPVQERVRALARMAKIDDDIFDDYTSVVSFESGGRHRRRDGGVQIGAVNPNTPERAVGIAQALPSTIRQYKHPETGRTLDPFNEEENYLGGVMYFAEGHRKTKAAGRDPRTGARIFYFGGPGRNKNSGWQLYARTGRIPPGQDANGTTFQAYVNRTRGGGGAAAGGGESDVIPAGQPLGRRQGKVRPLSYTGGGDDESLNLDGIVEPLSTPTPELNPGGDDESLNLDGIVEPLNLGGIVEDAPDDPLVSGMVAAQTGVMTGALRDGLAAKPQAPRLVPFSVGGEEFLIPAVDDDGRELTDAEAVERYRKTTASQPLPLLRSQTSSRVVEDAEIDPQAGVPVPDTELKPLEFSSYDAQELSVPARAAMGAAQLAQPRETDIAANHPDRVGRAVEVRIKANKTHQPTENEIVDAALETLGEGYGEISKRYRAETGGRNLGRVDEVRSRYERRTGEHVVEFAPSLSFVRIANAYARGGLAEAKAESDRIDGERATPEPAPAGERNETQTARNTLSTIGVASAQTASNVLTGAQALATGAQHGFDSPEYDELLAEDKKNQRALTGAAESIPEERAITRKIVRGVANGILNPSNYVLGLSPAGFLTAHAVSRGHEGQANVRRGLVSLAPALAAGGVAGTLAGRAALPVRAGAQTLVGGSTNVVTAAASGERDPAKLAESFGVGAGMGLLLPGGRRGEVVGFEPLSITGRNARSSGGELVKVIARVMEGDGAGETIEIVFNERTGEVVNAPERPAAPVDRFDNTLDAYTRTRYGDRADDAARFKSSPSIERARAMFPTEQPPLSPLNDAPLPESPATLAAQMEALEAGRRPAVLVTRGAEMPVVPRGMKAVATPRGTFVIDPARVSEREVIARAEDGTFGELLGHVEPKSPATDQAVVALDPRTGGELQSSLVSPENVGAQSRELARQFPEARVETGAVDGELAQRVLAERELPASASGIRPRKVEPTGVSARPTFTQFAKSRLGYAINSQHPRHKALKAEYDALPVGAEATPTPRKVTPSPSKRDAEPTWQPFPEDSGSLNVPRASMPQIKGEHRAALVQFLKGRGVTHAQEEIAPNTLKPSQAEFSPEKVNKAKGFEGEKRSILVSSDGYVLDGHHQWLSDLTDAPDVPIPAIRLNAPIQQLLVEAARFPSSGVDKSSGAPSSVSSLGIRPRPVSQPPTSSGVRARSAPASPDAPARIVTREPLRPKGGLPRTVVVVELADGTRQPFYRSSGTNSKRAGEWFPFSKIDNPDSNRAWFDKDAYNEGDIAERDHPLHRYGTPDLQRIGEWLGAQNIPAGREVSHADINAHIAGMTSALRPTAPAVPPPGRNPATSQAQEAVPDAVQDALARLKSGESPNVADDLAALGAHHAAGTEDFATWSKRMIDHIDESVTLTPGDLDQLYSRSRAQAGLSPDDGGVIPASAGRPSVAARVAGGVRDALMLPKALVASFDLSGVGNGGLPQVLAHPSFLRKSLSAQMKAAVSQSEFDAFAQSIRQHPDFGLMEESGLHFSSLGDFREEAFDTRLAEKIPGIKQSSRAYSVALDSLRVQAFQFYKSTVEGKPHTNSETYKAFAELANISTGRGVVPVLDRFALGRKIVDLLNLPAFSIRKSSSKFNLISPLRIIRNASKDSTRPVAYRQMIDAGRGVATLATTLALIDLIPGIDTGLNPFDKKNFAKIRIGRMVYDVGGGISSSAAYVAQMFASFADIEAGKDVDEKKTPLALTLRYLRSQLSPSASVAVDGATGERFDGEEFSKFQAAADLSVPFMLRAAYDAWKASGGSTVSEVATSARYGDARGLETGFSGVPYALPSVLGVGFKVSDEKPDHTPLKPQLSDRSKREIERLRINLDALGEKRNKSVSVKPGHGIEGVTGDSVKVFRESEGGERDNGSLGLSAQDAADELSRELDEAILRAMDSEDYQDRTDKGRRALLEAVALNVQKRAYLNPVRVEGREAERDELKEIEATQRRLEERSKGQPVGLRMTTGNK